MCVASQLVGLGEQKMLWSAILICLSLVSYCFCYGDGTCRTGEVSNAFVRSVMLSSRRVIPFYTQPNAVCTGDLSNITNSAECTIV